MKRKLLTLILALLFVVCSVCFFACGGTGDNSGDANNEQQQQQQGTADGAQDDDNANDLNDTDDKILSIYNSYVVYAQSMGETPLSYEQWLASVKGEQGVGISKIEKTSTNGNIDTYTITLTNGNTYTFTVANASQASAIDAGATVNLHYMLNAEGTGYIVAGIGLASEKDIVISSTYNGLPVTGIGFAAFADCRLLTSITIPNSVTSIGASAFENCDSLTNVNYLGTIDQWAMIEFDSSSTPTYYAKDLYINGVLVREANLTTATKINDYAFINCRSLESITIGSGVTSIGYCAFAGCSSLQYYEYDNALYLGNSDNNYLVLVKAKNTSITSCQINSNTKVIYGSAFSSCLSLQSITIPNSVTSIGRGAFTSCIGLTSITIPESVTSIGDSAFTSCIGLTSITIPNSVTSIGAWAFSGCSSLESITIPNSVTSIGDFALSGCSNLQSITIPNSVTSIGDSAFYNCSSLTSIEFTGTIAEWNNIAKVSNWNSCTGNYTIRCTDGDIAKS